jgi:serine/threonine protein kinase
MTAGARQQTSERGPRGKASSLPDSREPLQSGRELAGGLCLECPLGPRRTVWLAHDAAGRPWAVKTATPALIEHEARILAALSHPQVVRLQAVVRSESGPVLVLEYLAGGDLVSLAGAAPVQWLGALAAVVDALGYLHGQGIAHRDLKARNVLLDADDRARLVDFGSALPIGSAWTDAGTTAAAVAPDRAGAPVSAADDVYALAALAHELLYGAPPGGGRRPKPPSEANAGTALPLAAAVDACLASHASAAKMGLEGFRTVIESLRERNLRQP